MFSFLKDPVYSTDAKQEIERSNSGITHCGNKYQKKNLFPHFHDFGIFYSFSGQDLNVGLVACYFCSLFSVHFQQMDFDSSFLLLFFVFGGNICSPS